MEKVKLQNSLIKALVENGLPNTTDHSVDPKYAYWVYNFRREVLGAYDVIFEKRAELVRSVGIEKPKEFDVRIAELAKKTSRTEEEQKELEAMDAQIHRFMDLFDQLLQDESELNVRPIPYEEYHKLAAENKNTRYGSVECDFFTKFRDDLENILWVAPDETD